MKRISPICPLLADRIRNPPGRYHVASDPMSLVGKFLYAMNGRPQKYPLVIVLGEDPPLHQGDDRTIFVIPRLITR
ncbi:hypothetical protein [Micromonospora sp. NPDC048898]|uniref:hypothetical protein n=1 Tax=Micromonospora sp. NPDC048898 TaxID=3364260 RepID=UPI00371A4BEB